jgi:hypothetical protein
VFAPPKLDSHHPGQGICVRALKESFEEGQNRCRAKPEDYDEMLRRNDVVSRFDHGFADRSTIERGSSARTKGDPDASARQLA